MRALKSPHSIISPFPLSLSRIIFKFSYVSAPFILVNLSLELDGLMYVLIMNMSCGVFKIDLLILTTIISGDSVDSSLTNSTACFSWLFTKVTTPPEGFFTFFRRFEKDL